jgi:hypothetical protein
VDTLAHDCTVRPPIERKLAEVVFRQTPDEFRALCRELTPALATLMARSNAEFTWEMNVDTSRWKAWCERDGTRRP